VVHEGFHHGFWLDHYWAALGVTHVLVDAA
jgi:hypothetical protein